MERHFEEFGEIEKSKQLASRFAAQHSDACLSTVKVLQARGVGFVTYVKELSAQFAKEAMMCQSLDSDEVLNVRYAVGLLLTRTLLTASMQMGHRRSKSYCHRRGSGSSYSFGRVWHHSQVDA